MSAAPPPRASANAPRPIAASSPGLRRFGHPANLPLRWMPNRMRADVLALREFAMRRPLAGLGYSVAVALCLLMTLLFLGAEHGAGHAGQSIEHAAIEQDAPHHAKNTIE